MRGADFIEILRRKLGSDGRLATYRDVASYLGITSTALWYWRGNKDISARQVARLIKSSRDNGVSDSQKNAIRPIVEFFELDPTDSRGGAKVEIFPSKQDRGKGHLYNRGLREQLELYRGIYIFHDTRGRALYAGRTNTRTLWAEINNAYNRERAVQKIRRVGHPGRQQEFRTLDEKRRQIRLSSVRLYDLAGYVSAYQVSDGLIGELESLLIRSFANDLLNVRMENFGWLPPATPRKRRKSRKSRRAKRP